MRVCKKINCASLNFLTRFPGKIIAHPKYREFWIGQERLFLCENQLQTIPVEIGQLGALQKLFLSNNQLRTIPAEILQLDTLQELYIYDNHLSCLPENLKENILRNFGCRPMTKAEVLASQKPGTIKELKVDECVQVVGGFVF